MSTVRFEFAGDVTGPELEDLVAVAEAAAEGLVGAAALAIESPAAVDPAARSVEIDAGSEAGRCLARVLASLAERTIGRGIFRVLRIEANTDRRPEQVKAT